MALYVSRYDNRAGGHSHWSDDTVLRGRALFLAKNNPARLTIKNINYSDQSLYKCRVDFKMAPTAISSITLTVIGEYQRLSKAEGRTEACEFSMFLFTFLVPPKAPTIYVSEKASSQDLIEEKEMTGKQKFRFISKVELSRKSFWKTGIAL